MSDVIKRIETHIDSAINDVEHIAEAHVYRNTLFRTVEKFMSSLWDTDEIHDYTVSVLVVEDDHVSLSVIIQETPNVSHALLNYQLMLPAVQQQQAFDAAMKGI